jgi:hypothetical protein
MANWGAMGRYSWNTSIPLMPSMSALLPKADIAERLHYFRFVPKADIMSSGHQSSSHRSIAPFCQCAPQLALRVCRSH